MAAVRASTGRDFGGTGLVCCHKLKWGAEYVQPYRRSEQIHGIDAGSAPTGPARSATAASYIHRHGTYSAWFDGGRFWGSRAFTEQRVNVSAGAIRAEIERNFPNAPESTPPGELPFTPRKQAMHLAESVASNLCQKHIGPEHLLMGLVLEGSGLAAQVMQKLGVKLDEIGRQAFKTRVLQMKIVENVVRPVRSTTAHKRRVREELLAHFSAIYDEEYTRLHESAAALKEATTTIRKLRGIDRGIKFCTACDRTHRLFHRTPSRLACAGVSGPISDAFVDFHLRRFRRRFDTRGNKSRIQLRTRARLVQRASICLFDCFRSDRTFCFWISLFRIAKFAAGSFRQKKIYASIDCTGMCPRAVWIHWLVGICSCPGRNYVDA